MSHQSHGEHHKLDPIHHILQNDQNQNLQNSLTVQLWITKESRLEILVPLRPAGLIPGDVIPCMPQVAPL